MTWLLVGTLLLLWPCHGIHGQSLEGKTLKIVTILNNPFVTRDIVKSDGSISYKGYYIDLLNLLQRELKFNYEIYEVADGKYGSLDGGRWTGLIGDIVDKKANITLATLRITASRMKAVDFTVPVSASGMSILYKKPLSAPQPTSTVAALVAKPFAPSTWILLLLLYIIYTALAFAIWLLSPYELNHRSLESTSAISKAKKAGCGAWLFITGSLFLQGFARTPKAPSARILAFAWWLFVLSSVSCYIANLVPILMQLRGRADGPKPPFESLQDLVRQTRVSYGAIDGGATQKMLNESSVPEFQTAAAYMARNPQSNVNTIQQAIDKVMKGNYAWIAEDVTTEYYAMALCELASISVGLNSFDFGLAIAKGSDLKPILDDAILKIRSSGELGNRRGRWWVPDGGPCDASTGQGSGGGVADSLLPGDLVCLYALLLVGGIAALAVLPVELKLKAAGMPTCGMRQAAQSSSKPEKDEVGGASAAAAVAAEGVVKDQDQPPPESRPLV